MMHEHIVQWACALSGFSMGLGLGIAVGIAVATR